eukprot:1376037-Alexandrium_andersonii.AAC.1
MGASESASEPGLCTPDSREANPELQWHLRQSTPNFRAPDEVHLTVLYGSSPHRGPVPSAAIFLRILGHFAQ